MKTIKLKSIFIISLFALILFTGACKVSVDVNKPDDQSPPRSASYWVGNTNVTVSKPFDGIFNNNGTINNLVQLVGKDGSEIDFSFIGTSPATYQLKGYPDAVYTSPTGAKYNATSGTLVITSYKVDGNSNTLSGTFSFIAKSITNDQNTVTITNGIITNCSDEL
jgi:hypothetical protein